MRAALTLVALAILLVVGVHKTWSIWRKGLWRDSKVRAHLFFWVNGAMGISLLLTPVYEAVDGWTGMNNLAWLLAYLLLLLPAYLVGVQVSGGFPTWGGRIRLLLKWGFLATSLALLLLYVGWIRLSPEWPQRTARTLVDLLFISLFFTTISALPALTLALIRDSFRRRGSLAFRLRVSVSAVAMIAALTCFGSKVAGAVMAYWLPASPLGGQLDQLAWAAMGLTAVAWLVSMLPNRVFLAAVGPVLYLGKVLTLRELRRLYGRLVQLAPPVVAYQPTWMELLRRPDFHLYRLAIGILDGRKMIMGHATAMRRQGGLGPGPRQAAEVDWTRQQWLEAEVLETLLTPIRAEELDELAWELAGISRQVERLMA